MAIDVPATCTTSTSVASEVSGDQRARPIDPTSSTLRHIAGTASPAGTATTTAADSAAPRNRRSGAGPLDEQLGTISDDDDMAAVVEPGQRRSATSSAIVDHRRVRQPPAPVPRGRVER